jgi:hypothetical protein
MLGYAASMNVSVSDIEHALSSHVEDWIAELTTLIAQTGAESDLDNIREYVERETRDRIMEILSTSLKPSVVGIANLVRQEMVEHLYGVSPDEIVATYEESMIGHEWDTDPALASEFLECIKDDIRMLIEACQVRYPSEPMLSQEYLQNFLLSFFLQHARIEYVRDPCSAHELYQRVKMRHTRLLWKNPAQLLAMYGGDHAY